MAEKRCDKSIEYTSFGIIGRNIVGDYGGNECYNTSINRDLHKNDIKDFWDIPIEKIYALNDISSEQLLNLIEKGREKEAIGVQSYEKKSDNVENTEQSLDFGDEEFPVDFDSLKQENDSLDSEIENLKAEIEKSKKMLEQTKTLAEEISKKCKQREELREKLSQLEQELSPSKVRGEVNKRMEEINE